MAAGPFLDFVIEFTDGIDTLRRSTVRALGVAVDGDEVVFFNQWPTETLVGVRIPLTRIRRVTTNAEAKGLKDGMPPWTPPQP